MNYYISKQQEIGRIVYPLSTIEALYSHDFIHADFETTGLDPFLLTPILLGLQGNTEDDDTYTINLLTYDASEIAAVLMPLRNKRWIAHNARFEYKIIAVKYGIFLPNVYCTMINSQILYNGTDLAHGYADLVERHFGDTLSKQTRSTFINRDLSKPIEDEEIEYLVKDLVYLPRLYRRQQQKLAEWELLECSKLENAFLPCLARMELHGVRLDVEKWNAKTRLFEEKTKEAEKRAKHELLVLDKKFPGLLDKYFHKKPTAAQKAKTAGTLSLFDVEQTRQMTDKESVVAGFNLGSTMQIKQVLNHCGVSMDSTKEEFLEAHVLGDPDTPVKEFITAILDMREYAKIVSTYGSNYLKFIHPVTGRIHSDFTQNSTATGRLSSSKPNLQNQPTKDEIRHCYVADPGYLLVDVDMAGQELRLAAAHSLEPMLLDTFNNDFDVHSYLAQESYSIIKNDPDFVVSKSVNKDIRTNHKRVLFGFNYGAGASRIASVLNISIDVAKKVYNRLKQNLPVLSRYQYKLKKKALADMYVRDGTKYNRLKHFNWLVHKKTEDFKVENEGVNFPIQAGASAMMKEAWIELQRVMDEEKWDAKIILQVHDEFLIQIPENRLDYAERIKKVLEDVGTSYLKGHLRMEVEMSVEPYWAH